MYPLKQWFLYHYQAAGAQSSAAAMASVCLTAVAVTAVVTATMGQMKKTAVSLFSFFTV